MRKLGKLRKDVHLRAHQRAAVSAGKNLGGRVLFAHGTGTGKTLSAIATAEDLRNSGDAGNVLVLTPASLQTNFIEKGVKKFTDNTVGPVGSGADYSVMSLEKFRKDPDKYLEMSGADTVIVDEIQRAKDPGSVTHKALLHASGKVKNFIGLTGSFISNHPKEVVPLMDIARPKHLLGSQRAFSLRHVKKLKEREGWFGPTTEKLHLVNKPKLSRNLEGINYVSHEDMGASLPKLDVKDVLVPMSSAQKKYYEFALGGLSESERAKIRKGLPVNQSEAQHIFSRLMQARQASNSVGIHQDIDPAKAAWRSPKLRRVINDVAQHIKDTPDARPIVYTNFVRGGADELEAGFRAKGLVPAVYTGQNKKERDNELRDFIDGKRDVMILTPAGGEGVSIDNATMFAEVDRHYNPERNQQAIARGRRIGGLSHRPQENRVLKVNRYFSDPRTSMMSRLFATDVGVEGWIDRVALRKDELNQEMRDVAMKKVAVNVGVGRLRNLFAEGTEGARVLARDMGARVSPTRNILDIETPLAERLARYKKLRRSKEFWDKAPSFVPRRLIPNTEVSTLKRTAGGRNMQGYGSMKDLRFLGKGSEGQARAVIHPEHGTAVEKVFDPKYGLTSPLGIQRKEEFYAAIKNDPEAQQVFSKFYGAKNVPVPGEPGSVARAHYSEFLPHTGSSDSAVERARTFSAKARATRQAERVGERHGFVVNDAVGPNVDNNGKVLDAFVGREGELNSMSALRDHGIGLHTVSTTPSGVGLINPNMEPATGRIRSLFAHGAGSAPRVPVVEKATVPGRGIFKAKPEKVVAPAVNMRKVAYLQKIADNVGVRRLRQLAEEGGRWVEKVNHLGSIKSPIKWIVDTETPIAERLARFKALRQAGKKVTSLKRTAGGRNMQGYGSIKDIRGLGQGSEGSVRAVIHPEYGTSAEKVFDFKQGLSSPLEVQRKEELFAKVRDTPDQQYFVPFYGAKDGRTAYGDKTRLHYSELVTPHSQPHNILKTPYLREYERVANRHGMVLNDVRPANMDEKGRLLDVFVGREGELAPIIPHMPNLINTRRQGAALMNQNRQVRHVREGLFPRNAQSINPVHVPAPTSSSIPNASQVSDYYRVNSPSGLTNSSEGEFGRAVARGALIGGAGGLVFAGGHTMYKKLKNKIKNKRRLKPAKEKRKLKVAGK